MAPLKTVLLKGVINKTLTFPLTSTQNVREGEWQISLCNVSFLYNSKEEHPAKIPRAVLKITSNYVLDKDINERGEVVTVPAILSVVKFGANHGSIATIGFKNRDFFTINNTEQDLVLKFETVDTETFVSGASVFLLVALRRVR